MNLVIVLDSNIFLLHLRKEIDIASLPKHYFNIQVHVIMVEEVLRNISEKQKKEFFRLLFDKSIEVSDAKFPGELLGKYKKMNLKKGDLLMASFCEYVKTDFLITANRHFLKSKIKDFQILSFEDFCRKHC